MTQRVVGIGLAAGLLGGFVGNAVLGVLFTSGFAQAVLYDVERQSQLFLTLTPQRDVASSVAGLVALSAVHGWLYLRFREALCGEAWWAKGCAFGCIVWSMYWLAQEWFVYVTLLGEPVRLAAFELALLLAGSLVEGLVIAAALEWARRRGYLT